MANTIAVKSLGAVRFQQTAILQTKAMFFFSAPVFTQAEFAKFEQNREAAASPKNGAPWCTLVGWLGSLDQATVLCRKSGLSVVIPKDPAMQASLLQADANSPAAKVVYTTRGGVRKEQNMEVVVDVAKGVLRLMLPIKAGDLFDELVTAMTDPNPAIELQLSYSHTCQVEVPAPQQPVVRDHRTDPPVIRFRPGVIPRMMMAQPIAAQPIAATPMFAAAAIRPEAVAALRTTKPVVAATPIAADRVFALDRKILRDGRVFQVDPPPAGVQIESRTIAGQLSLPLGRPRTDTATFPDLATQVTDGWQQVPLNPKLNYRGSERPDTFYFIPTKFRLGYWIAEDGTGRPPYRVELYRTDQDEYRVKATLVALPCMEDAERTALFTHLRDEYLRRSQPYVYLKPRTGLEARFSDANDFTSGTASEMRTLPSDIRFEAVEVVPSERLVLRFDMRAGDYSIFCELLRKGIRGRVGLAENNFSAAVDVRLELNDIVTNSLRMTVSDAVAAQGDQPAQPPALTVENVLKFPVSLSALRASYIDAGEESHLIYDAEQADLLPSGGSLQAPPDNNSRLTFPLAPTKIQTWDDLEIEPGLLHVQGGSVDDWLNRTHRDPSAEMPELQTKVTLLAPAGGFDQVKLVRVRIIREGDAEPRDRMDIVPGSGDMRLKLRTNFDELAGQGGKAAGFVVDYDTVDKSDRISLSQRLRLRPDDKMAVLRAIVEPAQATYIVDFPGASEADRQPGSRADAQQRIDQLRAAGKTWEVFVQSTPADTGQPSHQETGNSGTGSTTPTPTGPGISIVTDLLDDAFKNGKLKRVLLALAGTAAGAATSNFVFDAANQAAMEWKPASVSVPPFHFKITYLYQDGQKRDVEGNGETATLILDPPSV